MIILPVHSILCRKVRILSSEDIDSGKYTVEDIALPVLGTKTVFPTNSTGDR